MFVAWWDAGPVNFDGDIPEAVGQVAVSAAGRTPAQFVAALGADEPVVGAVHHSPEVPVGLVDHHLGDVASVTERFSWRESPAERSVTAVDRYEVPLADF
ncbi:hypothetical protein [Nonomuraea polychroma]|uniref:hypothetical protein n=1 Tax=Nonomuraea polychroma TaxID=46176 RepID=UPI0013E3CF3C|nr:hypothetical protein [Nonomuraea polychroma]